MSLVNAAAPEDFFDLHWEDLRNCLPGCTSVTSARAWVAHPLQGLHDQAHARALAFAYPTSGGERIQTIFVKRITDLARAESGKYRYLEARGIPTPRLLSVLSRDDGEIVLLEHLPTIGVQPEEADVLLDLMARLNGADDPDARLFRPREGLPTGDFESLVVDALEQLVPDPSSWLATYRRAVEYVSSLPVALNHGEFYFQQVGWAERDGRQHLVLFDLDTMALLPYLTDLSGILRPLATRTGRSEAEIFTRYLELLSDQGRPLDRNRAWRDLRWTRVVRSIESLPWLLDAGSDCDVAETLHVLSEDVEIIGS